MHCFYEVLSCSQGGSFLEQAFTILYGFFGSQESFTCLKSTIETVGNFENFTTFSTVSIVDFEQVNVCWVYIFF